jgi:hypothetical protein
VLSQWHVDSPAGWVLHFAILVPFAMTCHCQPYIVTFKYFIGTWWTFSPKLQLLLLWWCFCSTFCTTSFCKCFNNILFVWPALYKCVPHSSKCNLSLDSSWIASFISSESGAECIICQQMVGVTWFLRQPVQHHLLAVLICDSQSAIHFIALVT